jgi:glycosyltransferase involved in cell wall biosynthesis
LAKILIVSQYWEPDVAGDVTRLRKALGMLDELGHEVLLVTTSPHYPSGDSMGYKMGFMKLERKRNLTVIRFKMPPIAHYGFARRLVLYSWFSVLSAIATVVFGRRRYVWAFSQKVFSTYSSLPAKFIWRAKLISDVTDIWPEALVNTGYSKENTNSFRLERFLARFAYKVSDTVTTLTAAQREMLCEGYEISPSRVALVPNTGRRLSRREDTRTATLTLLYFGNLGLNYDFEPILHVASYLRKDAVEFIIRGSGEGATSIRRTIARLNLENVTMYEQQLGASELSQLIASSDMFLLPMRKQSYPDASLPIKFVEYLWNAKPVVLLGEGYVRSLVSANGVGIVASYDDPTSLVSVIRTLCEERDRVNLMGTRAAALAERDFSDSVMKDSIGRVFGVGLHQSA